MRPNEAPDLDPLAQLRTTSCSASGGMPGSYTYLSTSYREARHGTLKVEKQTTVVFRALAPLVINGFHVQGGQHAGWFVVVDNVALSG